MSSNKYDQCNCGNKKQVSSEICRKCYLKDCDRIRTRSYSCSCGGTKTTKRSSCCRKCYENRTKQLSLQNNKTIGEYTYKAADNPSHFVKIRQHARKIAQHYKDIDEGCEICGFEFVDICHVKAIKDWPNTTTLQIVNAPSNLIILCKNCHWLFDHGYPSEQAIKDYYSTN